MYQPPSIELICAACVQVYFGLPTPAQRLAILRVHTQRWGRPPPPELLQQVRIGGDAPPLQTPGT